MGPPGDASASGREPSFPAAHERVDLPLLPSGPGGVHRLSLRGTWPDCLCTEAKSPGWLRVGANPLAGPCSIGWACSRWIACFRRERKQAQRARKARITEPLVLAEDFGVGQAIGQIEGRGRPMQGRRRGPAMPPPSPPNSGSIRSRARAIMAASKSAA